MGAPKNLIKYNEWRRKISYSITRAQTGKPSPMKGKKRSERYCKIMSESLLRRYRNGYVNPNKNKKLSDEIKEKLSKAGMNKKRSLETRKRMSEGAKKKFAKMTIDERRNWMKPALSIQKRYSISSIEDLMCEALDSLNIKYKRQKRIGRWYADIYIFNDNLIVECNGDYWHSLPNRIKRDKEFAEYCKEKNIRIIFIWESEIKKNPRKAFIKEVNVLCA